MRLIRKIIGLFFLLILDIVLLTALCPVVTRESKALGSYENIIGDNVTKLLTPVTDIAMLGAHDAFSEGINYKSGSNTNEDGIHNNKIVNKVAKGFVIKLAKAQVADTKQMLYKGVRYFDVRVTRIDGVYYTAHGLLSNTLDSYVTPLVEFLSSHPKEFVVFDIQHYQTEKGENKGLPEADQQALLTYLDDLGLMEYVNYTAIATAANNPSLVTYSSVTNNQTKGGVVILYKSSIYDSRCFNRDNDGNYDNTDVGSIRSYWHNKNSAEEMITGMEREYNYINDNKLAYSRAFRVNQAQMTGFIMNTQAIIRTVTHASLIGLARSFNKELITDIARFNKYLTAMPILMVDYATSNFAKFNSKANDLIAAYNRGL